MVALTRPTQALFNFYKKAGFEVIRAPGIYTFEHTTALWARLRSPLGCLAFMRSLICWRKSMRLTLSVVAEAQPDLVHLNSVALVPSAIALAKANIPFVWHVREAPVKGYFGLRTRLISAWLKRLGNEVIFISQSDRQSWVGNYRGQVIYNFVNLRVFHPGVQAGGIKKKLRINDEDNVILHLGGISEIKGIHVLLKAIWILRQSIPKLICLMPGSNLSSSGRLISLVVRKALAFIGTGVISQKVERQIQDLDLGRNLRLLPFQEDVAPFIAASDVVVFPSIRPHFARPIVEAAAMAKPTIGSYLDGVKELIEHERTGILVEPGSSSALAAALKDLLTNPANLKLMGENALKKARKDFDAKQQIAKITEIYDSIPNRFEQ
jgi:glycosyltransferase involved in cell wall biosynthesis